MIPDDTVSQSNPRTVLQAVLTCLESRHILCLNAKTGTSVGSLAKAPEAKAMPDEAWIMVQPISSCTMS